MIRNSPFWTSGFAICTVLALGAGARMMQPANDLGIFTAESSIGQTPPGCAAHYDTAKGEYRITGGGQNIWGTGDDFYFVWKKMSGDISLTADVGFTETSATEHRKAVIMIRQSLDRGSVYADVASHGNGLTALQFRGTPNASTFEISTQLSQPVRIRLVRHGVEFTMYSGKPGEELKASDPVGMISLKDPVYVGLGVCAHAVGKLETATFTNVKLEQLTATP